MFSKIFKRITSDYTKDSKKLGETSAKLAETTSTFYHENIRQTLQSQLDNPPPLNQILKLLPQEYPGPLFIKKSVIIDGQGATLWALTGPVLSINANEVTIRNLNVEVTGDVFAKSEEECALYLQNSANVQFENVQVRGQITGIERETGQWQYPHSLHIGELTQNTVHQFSLNITVPTQCQIESAISGVQVTPTLLLAGTSTVNIKIEPLSHDISLYGSLYLKSAQLKRRIYLTAHIVASEPSQQLPAWSPLKEIVPKPLEESKVITSQPSLITSKSNKQRSSQIESVDNETHLKRLKSSVFFTDSIKKETG